MDTDNIKRVRVLPLEEMYFLKKIKLEDMFSSAIVCYARKVNENYKLNPEEKAKEEHLIFGYKEEEYPSDDLDKRILEKIFEKFPDAKVQTSLMMLDAERENNVRWASQYRKEMLHIAIEYIPSSYPYTGAEIYQKDIEVFYFSTMSRKQRMLSANVNILTDQFDEYKHLCSLLKDTYSLFSKACKLNNLD